MNKKHCHRTHLKNMGFISDQAKAELVWTTFSAVMITLGPTTLVLRFVYGLSQLTVASLVLISLLIAIGEVKASVSCWNRAVRKAQEKYDNQGMIEIPAPPQHRRARFPWQSFKQETSSYTAK